MVNENHGIGRYRGLVRMDLGDGELGIPNSTTPTTPSSSSRCPSCHVICYRAPTRRRRHSWVLASGKRPRKGRRAGATPPPNCSPSMPPAPPARPRLRLQESDYDLRRRFRLRGRLPTRRRPSRGDRRHALGQADGPPGLRRRRLRQDRGRAARRLSPSPAASRWPCCARHLLCEQHYQTFCDRFADWPVKIAELVPLQDGQGIGPGGSGSGRRQDRHHYRHPQADRQGRQIQPPGPRRHRRGTPLRRAPEEETAEGAARRGRCPHLTATPIPHLAMSMEGLR